MACPCQIASERLNERALAHARHTRDTDPMGASVVRKRPQMIEQLQQDLLRHLLVTRTATLNDGNRAPKHGSIAGHDAINIVLHRERRPRRSAGGSWCYRCLWADSHRLCRFAGVTKLLVQGC